MAQEQKYYDVQTTAAILGITPAEVNQLRERNVLRGFRDGATWKFRVEDVHNLQRQMRSQASPAAESASVEEVLAAEPERSPGDASSSGSVLGLDAGRSPGDTDLRLRPEPEDELQLVDAEPGQVHAPIPRSEPEEEEIIPLAEGDFALSDPSVAEISTPTPEYGTEEHDIMLVSDSAPAGGSDVKIGHDSGISLLSPHDSGLSLEDQQLGLAEEEEDAISLGQDDMLTIAADSVDTSLARPDTEFRLTPTDDEYGLEDSESASQVIALAPEGVSAESPTLVAEEGLGPMFDELSGEVAPVVPGVGMAPAVAPVAGSELPTPAAVALPEAPYGTLAMVMLTLTTLVLVVAGMMVVDLVRNMWSWSGTITFNSWLMDMLAGIFG